MFRFALRSGRGYVQIGQTRSVLNELFGSMIRGLVLVSISVPFVIQLYVRAAAHNVVVCGRVWSMVRVVIQRDLFRILERVILCRLSNFFVILVFRRRVIFRSRGLSIFDCFGGTSAFTYGTSLIMTPAYLSAASPFLVGGAMKVLHAPGYTKESTFSSASRLPVFALSLCSSTDSSVCKTVYLRKPRRMTRGSGAANLPSTAVTSGLSSLVFGTVVVCIFRFSARVCAGLFCDPAVTNFLGD